MNVLFSHNIINAQLPADLDAKTGGWITDNPKLQSAGGFNPADYAPANPAAVRGRGVRITKLPGDNTGIAIGFDVKTDFFGNPIGPGSPDLGAIVYGGRTDSAPALGAIRK